MKRRTKKKTRHILTVVFAIVIAVNLSAGVSEKSMGMVRAATLGNPRIDSQNVVTWDCVYFGQYPQSDAKGEKKDPIKWRVLSVEGNDVFLVADKSLDIQSYNEKNVDVTWETCTLRSWLNGYGKDHNVCEKDYTSHNFIDRAFSETEQNAILVANLVNADDPKSGTEGGNDTQDKVFLLSYDDIRNPVYGLNYQGEIYTLFRYGGWSWNPTGKESFAVTAFLEAGGTSQKKFNYDVRWQVWLRSPGGGRQHAKVIDHGSITGCKVKGSKYAYHTVCPALHLDISSSDIWSYAGTVNSEGKTTDGDNPPAGTEQKDEQNNKETAGKGLKLTGISKKVAAGKKITLIPEFTPKNAAGQKLIWESSNEKYAEVSFEGVVTTKKAGAGKSVTITAKTETDSKITASYKITIVKHAVKSIKLKAKCNSVKYGKNVTVKATVVTTGKTANKALQWKSSNETYATVTKKGVVKAKKAGKGKTVKITALATDGTGKKAVVKIKIK